MVRDTDKKTKKDIRGRAYGIGTRYGKSQSDFCLVLKELGFPIEMKPTLINIHTGQLKKLIKILK